MVPILLYRVLWLWHIIVYTLPLADDAVDLGTLFLNGLCLPSIFPFIHLSNIYFTLIHVVLTPSY